MIFLILNGHSTREVAKKLFEMCIIAVEGGGYVAIYLPKDLDEEVNFIGVNFENLEVLIAELFKNRGLMNRVLVAKDRNAFDSLLDKLGERVCGITFLENFAKYVVSVKRRGKNRDGVWKHKMRVIEDLSAYRGRRGTIILLWSDYDFNYNSKRRRRTYLFNTIKRWGDVVRF